MSGLRLLQKTILNGRADFNTEGPYSATQSEKLSGLSSGACFPGILVKNGLSNTNGLSYRVSRKLSLNRLLKYLLRQRSS